MGEQGCAINYYALLKLGQEVKLKENGRTGDVTRGYEFPFMPMVNMDKYEITLHGTGLKVFVKPDEVYVEKTEDEKNRDRPLPQFPPFSRNPRNKNDSWFRGTPGYEWAGVGDSEHWMLEYRDDLPPDSDWNKLFFLFNNMVTAGVFDQAGGIGQGSGKLIDGPTEFDQFFAQANNPNVPSPDVLDDWLETKAEDDPVVSETSSDLAEEDIEYNEGHFRKVYLADEKRKLQNKKELYDWRRDQRAAADRKKSSDRALVKYRKEFFGKTYQQQFEDSFVIPWEDRVQPMSPVHAAPVFPAPVIPDHFNSVRRGLVGEENPAFYDIAPLFYHQNETGEWEPRIVRLDWTGDIDYGRFLGFLRHVSPGPLTLVYPADKKTYILNEGMKDVLELRKYFAFVSTQTGRVVEPHERPGIETLFPARKKTANNMFLQNNVVDLLRNSPPGILFRRHVGEWMKGMKQGLLAAGRSNAQNALRSFMTMVICPADPDMYVSLPELGLRDCIKYLYHFDYLQEVFQWGRTEGPKDRFLQHIKSQHDYVRAQLGSLLKIYPSHTSWHARFSPLVGYQTEPQTYQELEQLIDKTHFTSYEWRVVNGMWWKCPPTHSLEFLHRQSLLEIGSERDWRRLSWASDSNWFRFIMTATGTRSTDDREEFAPRRWDFSVKEFEAHIKKTLGEPEGPPVPDAPDAEEKASEPKPTKPTPSMSEVLQRASATTQIAKMMEQYPDENWSPSNLTKRGYPRPPPETHRTVPFLKTRMTKPLYCQYCDYRAVRLGVLDSQDGWRSHIELLTRTGNATKHARLCGLAAPALEPIVYNHHFQCHVCGIDIESPYSFARHLRSTSHKTNATAETGRGYKIVDREEGPDRIVEAVPDANSPPSFNSVTEADIPAPQLPTGLPPPVKPMSPPPPGPNVPPPAVVGAVKPEPEEQSDPIEGGEAFELGSDDGSLSEDSEVDWVDVPRRSSRLRSTENLTVYNEEVMANIAFQEGSGDVIAAKEEPEEEELDLDAVLEGTDDMQNPPVDHNPAMKTPPDSPVARPDGMPIMHARMVERADGTFSDTDDESDILDLTGPEPVPGPIVDPPPPQMYELIHPQRRPPPDYNPVEKTPPVGTAGILLFGLFLFTWAAIT